MIQLLKHSYFKYFLLVLLALKGSIFITENVISSIHDVEICYILDCDDIEGENENQKEFDELEKIKQEIGFITLLEITQPTVGYVSLRKKHITHYLEFNTPPPEFV